jgi:hypothetical protein|tara:strand:- start:1226 stop:2347 length:1122 start_codon:yes stop_codon:yes gene_type:complete
MAITAPAHAGEFAIDEKHHGIRVVAITLPPARDYDVTLLEPRPAVDNLTAAIDHLYAGSPFSAKALEKLKKAGNVTVVYDATFPKEKFAEVTLAAFVYDFFKKEGSRKNFLIVVSRFGVKWPTKELAGIIAHELVGHGIQHLRGQLGRLREIDTECEAELYRAAAYEDLGVDRTTSDMVRFYNEMNTRWCADFRLYLQKRNPRLMKLWDYGRRTLPRLIKLFEEYLGDLQTPGVDGNPISAAKVRLKKQVTELAAKIVRDKRPEDAYELGIRYLLGKGGVAEDGIKAVKLIGWAALNGHADAQGVFGSFYERGTGVRKNLVEAYKWYILAASRGMKGAEKHKRRLARQLSPAQIAEAEKRAKTWQPMPRKSTD